MFSCMYELVTAYYVRGYQSVYLTEILKKLVHTGLANCTRNIEKTSKNRVCWRTDILKTLLCSNNWARFSENSAFFHKKAAYIVLCSKITHISL